MDIKDRELHRIAVTAVIYNDEGKFLITKRSPHKKVFPNLWTVPGGGMEVDDYIHTEPNGNKQWYGAIEKTLRREVMEEVNVEIEKPEYFCDVAFIRPDNVPVLVLSYFAKYKSGEVELDDDAVEYAWISVDEIDGYEFIQGIDEEIKDINKILESRK
jgi:8-oxo-dGTP pyrophosphatase MutT (NUDIX family)